jgi:hypothetical protein
MAKEPATWDSQIGSKIRLSFEPKPIYYGRKLGGVLRMIKRKRRRIAGVPYNSVKAITLVSVAMGPGCLVNVKTPSSGVEFVTVGYVVAEQDANRAIKIIESKIAQPTDEVVAVCRVSEELLKGLRLTPGEFMRADGRALPKQAAVPPREPIPV